MKRKMHVSKSVQAAAFCLAGMIGILWAQVAQGEVTWSVDDGAGAASGAGELSFVDSQSLVSLSVFATNGVIRFSGPGLDFAGGEANVNMHGSTAFDLPITASGALAFNLGGAFNEKTYDDDFLKTTDKTLFTDVDLSKFSVKSALGGGKNLSSGTVLLPHYLVRGENYLTVQLQAIEGGWAKCIKVRLSQSGSDVVGRIIYARYRTIADFGADFDSGATGYGIATSATSDGYGVKSITIAEGIEGEAFASATQPVRARSLSIGTSVNFTADGDGVLSDDGVIEPALAINGELTITNVFSTTFTNVLSGYGTLNLGGMGAQMRNESAEITYESPMPTEWTEVAQNAVMAGITNVYINAFSGMAIPNSPGRNIYRFHNDGVRAIGQCQQLDGGWIKCVYLEFRQVSSNIQARILNACYCSSSNGLGVDFDELPSGTAASGKAIKQGYNAGSSPNQYVYGIGSFTMFFDMDVSLDFSPAVTVNFSGTNNMAGARINQRGGYACVTTIDGLPSGGASVYEVTDGGTLVLDAAGCSIHRGISNGRTILRALGGSTIVQNDGNVLHGPGQKIFLDASTLNLLPGKVQGIGDKDANDYINSLTLANGSRVTGKWPRITYCGQCLWKVEGTIPSVAETGMIVASTTGHVCTFDVDDVTEDGDEDFTIEKSIITYDTTQHTNVHVRKIGPGTMRWNAAARLYAPVRLDGGTLLLGGSKILGGTYPDISVQLGGGALAAAAGTSNAVGVVTVTNNSSIVVADGGVFTFADSSAKAWAPGMTLSITGEVTGTSVRFGESSAALTGRQQRALRVNGERARLDPQGYVRCGTAGTKLTLK